MPDPDESRPPAEADPGQRYLIEPDLLWVESVTERLLGPLGEHLGPSPARGPSALPAVPRPPTPRQPAPEQGPPRWSGPRAPEPPAAGVDPLDPRISLDRIAAESAAEPAPAPPAVPARPAPARPAPPASSRTLITGSGSRPGPEDYLTRPAGPEGPGPGIPSSPPLPPPVAAPVRATARHAGAAAQRRAERVTKESLRIALDSDDPALVDTVLRLTRELAVSQAQRAQLEAWLAVILEETADVYPGAALLRTLLRSAEPSTR